MPYRNQFLFHLNIFAFIFLMSLAFIPSEASAQTGGVLTSDAVIHRAGLMVEWSSQAPVGASNKLVDWELFVDENQATTTYEVRAGARRETISQHDRSPRGEVLGVAGGEKHAQDRREYMLAELAARGKKDDDVTIRKFQQPKATLFLMTDNGDVLALDANSGKTQWLSRVGSGDLPGIGLGVNENYVAVVRGSELYCLETSTGKELWSKKCKYAVGSSPAVTDDYIMVPLTDGRLELFPIANQGLGSHALMALGEGTAQPLVTASTVSWPTSRGELNVVIRSNNVRSISYRLRSDDAIVAPATTDGKTLFVGSLDGFLYAINETRGSVRWAISLGVGVSSSPVPLGDFVFAISDDHKLYKMVSLTGELAEGWETPLAEVSRFVGASEASLYVLDSGGKLTVIDRKSKAVVNRVGVGQIDLLLNNYQNDRLYVASNSGVIQCLREISSERPYFHGDERIAKPMEDKDRMAGDSEGSGTKDPTESENPFAGSGDENPFGGSGTKDAGSGTKDQGSGTKDQGSGTKDQGSGTKDEGSGTKDEGSGTKDEGSGTKDEGSGTKDGGDSADPFGGSSDDEDPFG